MYATPLLRAKLQSVNVGPQIRVALAVLEMTDIAVAMITNPTPFGSHNPNTNLGAKVYT